jgi:hypothetical protein
MVIRKIGWLIEKVRETVSDSELVGDSSGVSSPVTAPQVQNVAAFGVKGANPLYCGRNGRALISLAELKGVIDVKVRNELGHGIGAPEAPTQKRFTDPSRDC